MGQFYPQNLETDPTHNNKSHTNVDSRNYHANNESLIAQEAGGANFKSYNYPDMNNGYPRNYGPPPFGSYNSGDFHGSNLSEQEKYGQYMQNYFYNNPYGMGPAGNPIPHPNGRPSSTHNRSQ
jgi:hypothetical protein